MKKRNNTIERSMFTTVTAAIVGLAILSVSMLILPISTAGEVVTFTVGMLLVILCGITAFQGKKGAVKDIVDTVAFWK